MSNSSFWYDNKYNSLEDDSKPTVADDNMEKAALQRAIANFVSITTGTNIPVKFNTKDSSYTDGDTVVLGGNLNEKNFDHVVGLALHEASHILLTDFSVLSTIDPYDFNFQQSPIVHATADKWFDGSIPSAASYCHRIVKDLINIIEDRRIDYHIFKNAPGYKGYYHSMYAKYFRSKSIDKALKNNSKVEETWEDYLFHLINMTNVNRNIDALPQLRTVYKLIDLNNISRLKTTNDVKMLALDIFALIDDSLPVPSNEQSQQDDSKDDDGNDDQSASNNDADNSDQSSDDQKQAKDDAKLEKAIQAQKDFLNGKVKKTNMSSKKAKDVDTLANTPISEYQTETGHLSRVKTIVVEKVTKELIATNTLDCFRPIYNKASWKTKRQTEMIEAVEKGLRLGKALGNKLQIRNRETIEHQVRQRKGKVDGRALARLGFDDPTVFANTIISQHKDENIHISIDASGSMSGDNITNTISATAALAQALKMTTNMHLTVSIRSEKWNAKGHSNPLVAIIYDSQTDNINHIRNIWPCIQCNSNTPEGFCFPSLMKYLKPNTTFINFSDGMPGTNYCCGRTAIKHTKKRVAELQKAGHQVISFFIGNENGFYGTSMMSSFKAMYGPTSQFIDVNNMQQLANSFNKHWAKAA